MKIILKSGIGLGGDVTERFFSYFYLGRPVRSMERNHLGNLLNPSLEIVEILFGAGCLSE